MIDNTVSVKINQKFLYSLRPEKIIFLGIVVFIVALCIAPIDINGNLSLSALAYIVINLLFFFAGSSLIKSKKNKGYKFIEFNVKRRRLARIYRFFIIIASIAVVFKCIDTFLIRGVSWTASTTENTDAIAEGGGNLFSIIVAMIIFSTYIPITIDKLCPNLNNKSHKRLAAILFFFNLLDCLSTGSRFALIRPLIYFFLLSSLCGGLKNNKRIILIASLVILVLGNLIGTLMLRRMEDMHIDEISSMAAENGGFADKVPAKISFQTFMSNSRDTWYYTYLFTYVNVTQYVTHAVFEFPAVKDNVDAKGDYFYGASTFMVYAKFFQKIFGMGDISEEITKHNLRPGIWSTFFFSWYLDFGWFGPILFLFVGFFSKYFWYRAYSKHDILYIPIVLFMTIVWLLVLQLNYIQGSGTYAITLFLLIPVLFHIGKKYNYRMLPYHQK